MRVLRIAAPAIIIRRFRQIRFAEGLQNIVARRLLRLVRDTDRVGTDIGNQTRCALLADLYALIELLSNHHGAFRRESQLAGRILLHARRRKRRRGMLVLFALLDFGRGEFRVSDPFDDRVRLRLGFEIDLVAVRAVEAHVKGLFGAGMQLCDQCPVLFRDKRGDLIFTIAHDARRHGLYASRGQSLTDLDPKDRTDLVAHNAVQHASCLLRVDQIHIDRARLFDRVLHRVRRDLVKLDAALTGHVQLQDLREMPGNRFAFAVRVRCEKDAIGFLRFLLDAFQHVPASAERDIFRFKRMFGIDAELRFRKIADMTVARHNLEFAAQKLPDCLCLCRRLHDHQRILCLCHIGTPL